MTAAEHGSTDPEAVEASGEPCSEVAPLRIVVDVTSTHPLRGRISGPAGHEEGFFGWIGLSGAVASCLEQTGD